MTDLSNSKNFQEQFTTKAAKAAYLLSIISEKNIACSAEQGPYGFIYFDIKPKHESPAQYHPTHAEIGAIYQALEPVIASLNRGGQIARLAIPEDESECDKVTITITERMLDSFITGLEAAMALKALKATLPTDKEVNLEPTDNGIELSFPMARFETLPKVLADSLEQLKTSGVIKVKESGKLQHTDITPLEATDHQYPHGNIPNGYDVHIAVTHDKLAEFTAACSDVKTRRLSGRSAAAPAR